MSLEQVWACMAAILPAIVAVVLIGTIDLAYQVRAGDIMLRTDSLIRINSLSFAGPGRPWLDQQWLAQLLFAAAYRPLGWLGLTLLQGGLVAATFAFVYLACREAGTDPMRASLLSLAGFAVAATGLTLRPQLLGAVLFAATLWLLAGRRRHLRRLWLVPPLVALWASLHGSFFLGVL